jgi:hypothetical protein
VLHADGRDGSPLEAFARILGAVEGECRIHLEIAPGTTWADVSDEIQRAFTEMGRAERST